MRERERKEERDWKREKWIYTRRKLHKTMSKCYVLMVFRNVDTIIN